MTRPAPRPCSGQAPPLDPLEVPLRALSLVEASAGTGKTHAITQLYLRLLWEAEIPVSHILVVTFTDAATEELRARLRATLALALAALEEGAAPDAFVAALCRRLPDTERAARLLRRALLDFDEAAVHTIHGFCQRVLTDSAFETGGALEVELLPDESELLQETAEDFWRQRLAGVSTLAADFLVQAKITPASLLAPIRPYLGQPYLRVRSALPAPDRNAAETALAKAFERARDIWLTARDTLPRLLMEHEGLNKNKYRPGLLEKQIAELGRYLEPLRPAWPPTPLLEKFSARQLAAGCNKGHAPPLHPLFDACQDLEDARQALEQAFAAWAVELKIELLDYGNRVLPRRKAQAKLRSYNDLLLELWRGLGGDGGDELAERLRQRYPAVLVDEFQDTDPIQYDIFRRIYHRHPHPVFLVGDPKQAIYGFRGADVFAYLKAKTEVERRYTLNHNRRSVPDLVRGVNAVFAANPRAFLWEGIPFVPAESLPSQEQSLEVADSPETESATRDRGAPLRFWLLESEAGSLTQEQAARQAVAATAAEIHRLLALGARGAARIGDRALAGQDIAVLVRTHRQGEQVRGALLARGIPAAMSGQSSVFQSDQALQLERLLLALAEPWREPLARAALGDELLDPEGAALIRLEQDPDAWSAALERFYRYHHLWRQQGFVFMFRELLVREKVLPRLLSLVDGERRITNLLHLGELLDQASRTLFGMAALIQWLARQRQQPAGGRAESELRLESDEGLVRIVTVHKSKGLQYPVVFAPFLWHAQDRRQRTRDAAFHDPREDYAPTLLLSCPADAPEREYAAQEDLGEELRLLYVALTRAQHRVYGAWGAVKGAHLGPLGWLWHGGEDSTAEAMAARLGEIAAASGGAIQVLPLPRPDDSLPRLAAAPPEQWTHRDFPGTVSAGTSSWSFTALLRQADPEQPDYDPAGEPKPPPPPGSLPDRYGFPRGSRAGRCLHWILQEWDAAAPRPQLESLSTAGLKRHGFDPAWAPAVADWLEAAAAAPLDDKSLSLSRIPAAARLTELEFAYPLAPRALRELPPLLARHGIRCREPVAEPLLSRGFMKGYVDLVFRADGRYFLADYKSHWLGSQAEDYRPERLEQVMTEESYGLQYLIYAVALHRYLRWRQPGYRYSEHFGGIYYLFLRGMDPRHPGCGVFGIRPPETLIHALELCLCGPSEAKPAESPA